MPRVEAVRRFRSPSKVDVVVTLATGDALGRTLSFTYT